VEAAFHSGGVLRHCVVSDEEVCVGCQLGEACAVSVGISAEDDALILAKDRSQCTRDFSDGAVAFYDRRKRL
jgi:phage baseplate assembly protein gpV